MTDTETANADTGERLRLLANELYDGNKSALARALDMKPGSFSKYLRGERRPGATILNRLHGLGVNLNWLVGGTGPILADSPATTIDERAETDAAFTLGDVTFHRVPLLQVCVGDRGGLRFQEMDRAEWLSEDFINRVYGGPPDRLCRFQVSSNMMAPAVRSGDGVRAFRTETDMALEGLEAGAVYLLYGPAGVFAMRVHEVRAGHRVVLKGDNPEVAEREIRAEQWNEDYRAVARIVEVVRPL